MKSQGGIFKDLVLVGGGHSHVEVLKRFGMEPLDGVRLTLIAREVHTPYSGMLPGYIAGHYGFDDSHVDLGPLARFANCRLYHEEVVGLDLADRQVKCKNRPPVSYDVLSIDIGSTPSKTTVTGADEHALPVKPIDQFLAGWQAISDQAAQSTKPLSIAVVGGGAGGVELMLSVHHRVSTLLAEQCRNPDHLQFRILTGSEILPNHSARVRGKFLRILADKGIAVHPYHKVSEVTPEVLVSENQEPVPYDILLWVTHASAAAWPGETGLAVNADGFILVNDCLQSTSHPDVFAAGDIAAVINHPRPKSGVFAVRQGPPLANNLRRALLGKPLKRFKPQREALALISTGDRYAVASRGALAFEGEYVWRWKDWIDRRWMRKYAELPQMQETEVNSVEPGIAGAEAINELSNIAMRCGGCGSKVGSTVLSRVLERIQPTIREDVLVGLSDPDDAAVVTVPTGKLMVHTVDFFRAFIDDPYLFGRVAANHSLSDIFAMNASPQSALAMATVPYGIESKMEQQLSDVMQGATEVLNDTGAALVGGHTTEGAELTFGLAVNGIADPEQLLRKSGMQAGHRLILTKALGTGTLFAADMRGKAKGRWVDGAITMMLQSNRGAAECLFAHGARACTDVTGFGLLGHLIEMTKPSKVDVEIDLNALPILDGAWETMRMGIFSSLQPENIRLRRAIRDPETGSEHPYYPLLFDPQTSGGLLASVPQENAAACVQALVKLGYEEAAIIGTVAPVSDFLEPVTLLV